MGAVVALTTLLGAGAGAARAATTWTVTRTDDPSSGTCTPTSCSLRQAVAAAADGDTVLLPANTSHYTITTASGGTIVAPHAITIRGAGAASSVIDVQAGSGGFLFGTASGTVTVSGVTMDGATAAAALDAVQPNAFLVVRDTVLTGNSNSSTGGGAIFAVGGLQVIDSTLSGNSSTRGGGAIQADGVTTVSGSTITGNGVTGSNYPGGGGIFSGAALYIVASTIDHNTVEVSSGSTSGFGGGVAHTGSGSLTIENSTIADNVAETSGGATGTTFGGGLNLEDSAVVPDTILFSTIAGNSASGQGGDIYAADSATPTLDGSIIASGTAPSGADCAGSATPVLQTQGYNVESRDECGLAHGGTDRPNTDPGLGPLQANGGSTATMALLEGSPAIDLAPATGANCPGVDQRGVARPQPAGGRCDAGAYEYAPPTCQPLTAATIADQPIAVRLSCSDPSGAPVTYVLGAGPSHGSLSAFNASTGAVTYTAGAGYTGSDSFTYHASSANGTAASQTVSITVTPFALRPPAIANARLTHRRFRVSARATAISTARAPFGTTFRFTLSAPAKLTITITRSAAGLRSKSRCVAPTAKLRKAHARPCARTVMVGTLTRSHEPAGDDGIGFTGRIGRRPLVPGRYRAVLLAGNSAGRSTPVGLRFVIVR